MANESIGAIWLEQEGSKVAAKMRLDMDKIPSDCKGRFVIFKNNYKKESRHPDWRVFISKPQAEREAEGEPF